MRKKFLRKIILLLSLFSALNLPAQLVVTIAGVLESAGNVDGLPFQALFNNPHGIAVDSIGNIFVADRFGHFIRKIDPAGNVTTIAGTGKPGKEDGPGWQASFNEPWGLCVGSDGYIYVADTRNNLIRRIDPNGVVTTFAGTGNFGTSDGPANAATFGNPTGLEMDANGNLYVADHLTHLIRRIDSNGWVHTLAGKAYTPGAADGSGSAARFYRPYGLTIDAEGDVIVADEWNHLIRRVKPSGAVSTIAGTGMIGSEDGQGLQAAFNYPWDVVVDKDGFIYVADGYNNVIRQISSNGHVTTYVGTAGQSGGTDGEGPEASFSGATGLAYWPFSKEIFVADAYNNLIRKIIDLRQQTLGLLLLEPLDGTLCEGEELKVKALPEFYENYQFLINGKEIQEGTSPYFANTNLDVGESVLQVIATNENDTIRSSEVVLTVYPAPEPEITTIGDTEFYSGDSVILVSSYGLSYFWSTGETDALITVFESGFFSVEVEDVQGCFGSSDSIEIKVINPAEPPRIEFLEGSTLLCPSEKALLQSNYSFQNQWFQNGWPIEAATAPTLEVIETGIYQLRVSDDQGVFSFSEEISISYWPSTILDFTADKESVAPDTESIQFTAEAEGALAFYWDFGDGTFSEKENPEHTYLSEGLFPVLLRTQDEHHCLDTLIKLDYITVRSINTNEPEPLAPDSSAIFIPTAFTPNGDAINDIFSVRGIGIESVTLLIYNQWGELVFESKDQAIGWKGNFNGGEAQQGTYTYIAGLRYQSGISEQRTGHLTLIR